MKTDDSAFRQIWKMMAADLALLLAEWLVPLTVFIIVLYGDEAVSRTVMIEGDLDLYLLWTIRCLRLLTWLGMIVHLERLEGGFRSVKRWYLLRIFVFLTVQVLSGIQSQSSLPVGVGNPYVDKIAYIYRLIHEGKAAELEWTIRRSWRMGSGSSIRIFSRIS